MAIQNYNEMMPQASGLDSVYKGYQMGAGIQADQQQKRAQAEAEQQMVAKKIGMKSLTDLYSSKEFLNSSPEEQTNKAVPIISKFDPQGAQNLLAEQQKQKQEEQKKLFDAGLTMVKMFHEGKDYEGAQFLVDSMKKKFPGMDQFDIKITNPGIDITAKTYLKAGNPYNTPEGYYNITSATNLSTGKHTISKIEPWKEPAGAESNIIKEGMYQGRKAFARVKEGAFYSTDTGKRLIGFEPTPDKTEVDKPDSGQRAWSTILGKNLTNERLKDPEIKLLRDASFSLSQSLNLTNLKNNNIGITAATYTLAKALDPSGRISDKDIVVLSKGNVDLYNQVDRAVKAYLLSGTTMNENDLRALRAVIGLVQKGMTQKLKDKVEALHESDTLTAQTNSQNIEKDLKTIEGHYKVINKNLFGSSEPKPSGTTDKIYIIDKDPDTKTVGLSNNTRVSYEEAKKKGYRPK